MFKYVVYVIIFIVLYLKVMTYIVRFFLKKIYNLSLKCSIYFKYILHIWV